jgi:hypothetical protein
MNRSQLRMYCTLYLFEKRNQSAQKTFEGQVGDEKDG